MKYTSKKIKQIYKELMDKNELKSYVNFLDTDKLDNQENDKIIKLNSFLEEESKVLGMKIYLEVIESTYSVYLSKKSSGLFVLLSKKSLNQFSLHELKGLVKHELLHFIFNNKEEKWD